MVQLSSDATLRRVCVDILQEFGWPANARDNTQRLWTAACGYIERLQTIILVLDEIQHVRSAGQNDREALCGFLKSLVQPRQTQVVPIVVGMPDFHEVINSDVQLRRRFDIVNLRALDPALDRATAVQTLSEYAEMLGLPLAGDVRSKDFASRLLEASNHAFGEMCVVIQRAIKQVISENGQEITLQHFQDAHRLRYDCLPDQNPFVTEPF
ncbi:TniB family NTP-binding protein [Epibacterium ulvae]|uniref:TniB family NTP-binding protein n=1 Tax=Epibacterium ulvae TaxID=1156985 RepID=UPI0024937BA9|nr:TniB family NTP-binding protein [Epibacterium ulvae]